MRLKSLVAAGSLTTALMLSACGSSSGPTPATKSAAGVRAMVRAATAALNAQRFGEFCQRYLTANSVRELQPRGGCARLFAENWAKHSGFNRTQGIGVIYVGRVTISGDRATIYGREGKPELEGALYSGGHWRLDLGQLET